MSIFPDLLYFSLLEIVETVLISWTESTDGLQHNIEIFTKRQRYHCQSTCCPELGTLV